MTTVFDTDWFGALPAEWGHGNIRQFAKMKTGHTPSRSVPEYWLETAIPWFTLADVWQLRDGRQQYLGATTANISRLGLENSAADLLPAGTVVLSRTASVGFSGIMPFPMATSQDFWNWVCGPRLLPKYLLFVFRSMQPYLRGLMTGSTHKTIYQADAAGLCIPVPPIDNQRQIVGFLDRETAQIDELIAKQNALIELLAERRKAVITQAVTRGLDLSVQMKDSGVEWLGDVPAEWPVGRISYFSKVDLGKMVQPTASSPLDSLAPYMRAANVQPDGVVDLSNVNQMWFRLGELECLELNAGDVVVVEGGIGGYGRSAYLSESLPGWGYQNSINRIRMQSGHDGRYLNYVLLMSRFVGFIAAYCTGVSMPHLTAEKLERIVVPAPPRGVQVQIADFLDEATRRIDDLVQKAIKTMDLLRERRSALITAAVTGKIDVRGAA